MHHHESMKTGAVWDVRALFPLVVVPALVGLGCSANPEPGDIPPSGTTQAATTAPKLEGIYGEVATGGRYESMKFEGKRYTAFKPSCTATATCKDTGTLVIDIAARTVVFRDDRTGVTCTLLRAASTESGALDELDPAENAAALRAVGECIGGAIDAAREQTDAPTEQFMKAQ